MTMPPLDNSEETSQSETDAAPHWGRCHLCSGQLGVVVRVESPIKGQPVTYYACEQCTHVLVRKV